MSAGGGSRHGLVLSIFPGIDVLGMGFEQEGFCVVRGPDILWGGDIHSFHPPAGVFDGVIGGPPCQAFSRLRHLVEANRYRVAPNLIPEFERAVGEAAPLWFVMENVEAAPIPCVKGYTVADRILDNHWLGEIQGRRRRFSLGAPCALKADLFHIQTPALVPIEREPAVCASGGNREVPVAIGGSGKVKSTKARDMGYTSRRRLRDACRLQGLPEDFLKDAPFTVSGGYRAIGNAVPLPMARAVARAVVKALERKVA